MEGRGGAATNILTCSLWATGVVILINAHQAPDAYMISTCIVQCALGSYIKECTYEIADCTALSHWIEFCQFLEFSFVLWSWA